MPRNKSGKNPKLNKKKKKEITKKEKENICSSYPKVNVFNKRKAQYA